MSTYCIVVDEQRCIQCHACEIHCQNWHDLSAEVHPARLVTVPPQGDTEGRVHLRSAFLHCHHCQDPWCVRVCPTRAMRRRKKDGVVYVVQGLCVGCKGCLMACPWRVPQWSEALERMVKCDLCKDRLDAGQQPACVAGCTAHALRLCNDTQTRQEQEALWEATRRGDFSSAKEV